MRRRLISMLAAGLLAAGTLLAGGAASAGTAAAHRADCTIGISTRLRVIDRGVNYYLGTPNTTFSGAIVRLKPRANSTTLWTFCHVSGDEYAVYNRHLVLTSRDFSPGGLVSVESPGNSGNGFAAQRWHVTFALSARVVELQNVKTHLWLRVRNSGPIMGQTVTTGSTATAWTFS